MAASIADIWPARTRGYLMGIFSFSIFACTGTSLYIGTVIVNHPGFRWIGWITLILSLSLAFLYVFCLPETRANVLLYRKKRRLEQKTGWTYYAAGEEERMASWQELIARSLTRPICEQHNRLLRSADLGWELTIPRGFWTPRLSDFRAYRPQFLSLASFPLGRSVL